jgi:nitrogen regulatory protein P-II 2
MKLTTLKLVTLVIESVLEAQVVATIKEAGARGYTAVASAGEGSRGTRTGEIPGQNVRIETLVSAAVADKIMELVSARYFQNYAVVCWVVDASVLRGEKYV